jgi:hypothetical protein
MKALLQKAFFSALFLTSVQQSFSQSFLPAIERFSSKKEGFLVTAKGDTTKFFLDDLDRKKGLIVNVAGKTTDGKKFEHKAEDIQFLALAPADFAKYAAFNEGMTSVARAGKTDFKQINRDLVFFYQEYLVDKKRTVLVQLVNPGFDSQIRVYDDPFAAQTAGVGVAGVQMTGGLDKSYYVNHNGKTFRLMKSDYDKKFKEFFGSCPDVKANYKNAAWRDFAEHLYLLEQKCTSAQQSKL